MRRAVGALRGSGPPAGSRPGAVTVPDLRDVRFSKSPYKTHVSASFPWSHGQAERHELGGYFHFQPDEGYMGGGMWHAERPRLEAWRAVVANDPARVQAAIDDPAFVAAFGELDGDRLVRVPTGYPADHPQAELLKLKDVVFGRRVSDDEALSPHLPDILTDAFAVAVPVFRLLAALAA